MDLKIRCNLWPIIPVPSKATVTICHTQHPLHMSKQATLAACLALILAIVAAVFINRGRSGESASDKSPAAAKSESEQTAAAGGIATTRKAPPKPDRARGEIRHSELVDKYGESRTNLSKHITGNVIDLLQDTVEMGEMATSGQLAGAFGGQDAGLRMGLGRAGNELNLTEEQRGKAKALYAEFQKRQLEQSKESIDRLRKDPTAMMELMLASDAFARGQIDESEFKKIQQDSGKDLNGVLNPLDQRNFRGGRSMTRPSSAVSRPSLIRSRLTVWKSPSADKTRAIPQLRQTKDPSPTCPRWNWRSSIPPSSPSRRSPPASRA